MSVCSDQLRRRQTKQGSTLFSSTLKGQKRHRFPRGLQIWIKSVMRGLLIGLCWYWNSFIYKWNKQQISFYCHMSLNATLNCLLAYGTNVRLCMFTPVHGSLLEKNWYRSLRDCVNKGLQQGQFSTRFQSLQRGLCMQMNDGKLPSIGPFSI